MFLNASNLIDAIKSVRTLGQDRYKVSGFSGGERITLEPLPGMGLKEAKDFVEDIMALGVARYLAAKSQEAEREFSLRCEARRRAQGLNDDIKF